MNSFWKLIIKIRDIGYHWSIQQYGKERALQDYKLKIMLFISGYYLTLFLLISQILDYFFGMIYPPVESTDPYWMRAAMGFVIFGIPIWLLSRYLLKKVNHVPFSSEYLPGQLKKKIRLYVAAMFFGWFLVGTIGLFLTVYLRGGQISLFGHIWNQGGHSHTFEEDFGH